MNKKNKQAIKHHKHSKKVDVEDGEKSLSQSDSNLKTAEKIGEPYGAQNPKPSNYEKKLRSIFTELKSCEHITLKNKERNNEILS